MDLPQDVRFTWWGVSLKAHYRISCLTLDPACFLCRGDIPKPTIPAAIERMRLQHLYLVSHPDIAAIGRCTIVRDRRGVSRNVR